MDADDTSIFNILAFYGTLSKNEVEERTEDAFEKYSQYILDETGATGIDVSVKEAKGDDDDVDKIIDGGDVVPDEGINAGTAVGIAAAGLAFLLLLILLIKRNNDSDEVSHLKLEEDNEDTFIREFATTDSNPDYHTRNVHVVGEADSIFSGWTGYNSRDGADDDELEVLPGKLGHIQGDVHVCSSATCEVCERKRQQGVQFIPTGTPPRPHMPNDASREYISEDTVEL